MGVVFLIDKSDDLEVKETWDVWCRVVVVLGDFFRIFKVDFLLVNRELTVYMWFCVFFCGISGWD